ncbi:MAG TPA: hypothetical protein VNC22_13680 [Sporichthya sp.]|nr:hypothetical protein [Sporichthya sp.]
MRRFRRVAGGALVVLAALGMLSARADESTAAGTKAPAAVATAAPAGPEIAAAPGPRPKIIVVGVPGLRWSDIQNAIPTPGLWLLARDAALGAISLRTVEPTACPLDGWLTLNSGARAIGPRPDGDCRPVPVPAVSGTTATVPGWSDLIAPNDDHSYDPIWGTLAQARPGDAAPPVTTRCAVGPGAAVALADDTGRVRATYASEVNALPAAACSDLLLIDAGVLPLGPERAGKLREVDALVERLRSTFGSSALMVAGIADSDPDRAHLGALMVEAGDRALRGLRRGWLHGESTRRAGLVTITDLTPTLIPDPVPADLDGYPLQSRTRIESTPTAVRELDRRDLAAQVIRDMFVWFFVALIGGQLLLYAGAGLAMRRGVIDRRRCARVLSLVGLGFGSAPAASVLANLLPWRSAGHPAPALWGVVVLGSVAIAALAAAGPWRRRPYGPPAVVGLVTALVLGLDVVTGSRLELNGLFGLSPLVAGRFYGFGNIAFAVFAMCSLTTAAGAASYLIRRGREMAAGGVVLAAGAVAALVDGWPDFGADFGGVLALVPGVAVLAAGVSGVRITVPRVIGVALAAVGAAAGIALLDWRREPARRSHLGKFVQDVLDGNGPDVIGRKLDANFGLLVDAPIIVLAAIPLVVLAVLTLLRPEKLRLHGLARAQAEDPVLRPLMFGCLSTALVGFAVNDSGVIVPAVALIAAGPLLVAVWAGIWMHERS